MYNNATYDNDTWDWNRANWVQLSPATSPSGREFASMAYDPAMNGGELLLFGGTRSTGYYNDTWAWNGSTWDQVGNAGDLTCTGNVHEQPFGPFRGVLWPTTRPTVASWSCSAVTTVRRTLVTPGPGTAVPGTAHARHQPFGPLFSDHGLRRRHQPAGPVRRLGQHSRQRHLDLERQHQHLVPAHPASSPPPVPGRLWPTTRPTVASWSCSAAGDNGTTYNDTWDWNGATWGQLAPTSSPMARAALTMSYDVSTAQMVLSGGYNGTTYYNDTWIMGAPSVTALSAVSGATTGNTSVTITGTGFAGIAATGAVNFGTTAATYTVGSSTSITATSPAEAAGTVDVTVTGSAGTSPKTGADQFTYSNATWYQATPATAPLARLGHVQAYDPATGQTIVFGGFTGSYQNDTWSWNGANWVQVDDSADPGCTTTCTNSPSARDYATVAYDVATSQLVLFGGYTGTADLSDTWAWNGTTWTEVALPGAGPSARAWSTMAYDTASNQLVLFGGTGLGGLKADTWDWNGSSWSLLAPALSPSARSDSTIAYDPTMGGGELVLFGGSNGANLADTWAWNGTTWSQLSPANAPSAREDSVMAYNAVTNQLLLFGGSNIGAVGDTWAWTGATWPLLPANAPSARSLSGMAYDTSTSQMVLFGGFSAGDLGDTWIMGAPSVTGVSPVSADGRGHLGHPHRRRLRRDSCHRSRHVRLDGGHLQLQLVHLDNRHLPGRGGRHGRCHRDRHCRHQPQDGRRPVHLLQHDLVRGRPDHGAFGAYGSAEAYDPATGQTILFGGYSGSAYLGDTWDWNGANWVQLSPATSPSSRAFASMAYDPAMNGGELLLFGGASTGYYNDTWAWNGSTWSQVGNAGDLTCTTTCTNGPSVRSAASMAYDSANGGQLVLFGGTNAGTVLSDTWTWNGSAWAQLTPATSPPARDGASMAYDPANGGQLVLFGGAGTYYYNDTWTWNDATNTWAQLPPPPAPPPACFRRWPTTPPTGARWSCSAAGTAAPITTTPGTGTGRPGDNLPRPPAPAPVSGSPWRTTCPLLRWCCSAASTAVPTTTTTSGSWAPPASPHSARSQVRRPGTPRSSSPAPGSTPAPPPARSCSVPRRPPASRPAPPPRSRPSPRPRRPARSTSP